MGAAERPPRRFRWPWRRAVDIASEIDEEIAFHLDMRVEGLMREGLPEREARERALSEFGDVAGLRRDLLRSDARLERRRRWLGWLADLRQDARFAARSLAKAPSFSAVALATLALGIGAAVAMFTVVNAVLLAPLPYADADRLVRISPGQNFNMALADAVIEGSPSLESGTGLSLWGLTLTGRGEPTVLNGQRVDAGFFRTFGVQPILGRPFRPEEREPARSDVVLLSHALWQSRFGGDPNIVGRRLELEGAGHTTREVVGVMPPGFRAPLVPNSETVDVWTPLSRGSPRTVVTDSTWYVNWVAARLAPGATVDGAAREVRAVMARMRAEHGNIIGEETVRTAGAVGLLDSMVGDVRRTLLVLLAAVGLVLLLACANLANLFLARAERRRQELAVRMALGGTRGRLVRELLTETLVLALAGGAAGLLLARALLAWLPVAQASGLPRTADLPLDLRVIAFALAVTVGCALGFGLLPALRASGGALRHDLGSGGRSPGRTRAGRRLGFGLIAGEVALAMVLVTGAGLLLNSLRAVRSVDPGMDAGDVLALELAAPSGQYGGERAAPFYEQVRERLAALPGVRSVGAIQLLPFTDSNWGFAYLAEGHAPPADGPLPSANFRVVTPGYFQAVDVPLLAGRGFERPYRQGDPPEGLINRTMAERLWPGEDPIGKEIKLFGSDPFRVVGVVGDVRQHALEQEPQPEMYLPHGYWTLTTMVVMLETDVPPASLAAAAKRAVWEIDADVPVVQARPLAEVLGESMRQRRFFAAVLGCFGLLALTLGAVGVYGVMSYATSARVPEFGVRLALGATHASVLRHALASGLLPVLVGLAVGVTAAFAAARLIAGLLYGIPPRDPVTLALAGVVLGLVATAASWLPARRVTRLEPASVLRAE